MASIKIGKKLRMLREKFGYTQQHMANILNVDRSTYSYYETEKTSPDIATLITLSNVFCVGIEELLGQENSTTHQLHDAKYAPAASKSKDITSNDSFIYNLSGDEKQFILSCNFSNNEKCCFTTDERRPYPPTFSIEK